MTREEDDQALQYFTGLVKGYWQIMLEGSAQRERLPRPSREHHDNAVWAKLAWFINSVRAAEKTLPPEVASTIEYQWGVFLATLEGEESFRYFLFATYCRDWLTYILSQDSAPANRSPEPVNSPRSPSRF